tara:strand:+ start:1808 stop:2023 length:216 start_codon:yes stop_codon:yes gene_type:complete
LNEQLFFYKIEGSMLVKELIIKVARELKKDNKNSYQDENLLTGYPEDLSKEDVKKALLVVACVSENVINLY